MSTGGQLEYLGTTENSLPGTSFVPEVQDGDETSLHPLIGPPPRPGSIGTVGRFELITKIGEGGMGLIFLARDTACADTVSTAGTGKPECHESHTANQGQGVTVVQPGQTTFVALKILRAGLAANPRAVEYFMKEAEHARRLVHPHILPVIEASSQREGAWIVMAFAAGGSLANLLENGRPLAEEVILRVAKQVAAALEYAHARGIIHRDLKPSNVLFDSDGNAYLSDFGLARSLLNDLILGVEQTEVAGTPQYQSPTAAAGEHGDTRDDIYSFGAILYEMLTGRPPYSGKTRKEVLDRIRQGPPPPILALNPNAHPGLAKIAEWAMARDLRERYAHIRHVLEDLDLVIRGKPPQGPHGERAPTVTALSGLSAWLRRPMVTRSAVAILVLLLTVVAIWLFAPSLRVLDQIEVPGVVNWGAAKVGQLSGKAEPFFQLVTDNKLLTISVHGQVLAQWTPPEGGDWLGLDLVRDITGDETTDAIVHWCRGDQSIVSVIQNWNEETYSYSISSKALLVTPNHQRPELMLEPMAVFDLDRDGRFETLAILNQSTKSPRGIYCIRFPPGELVGSYLFAPWPTKAVAVDLDGDGIDEIVTGSAAVGNGVEAEDGTLDKYSYLFALTMDCKPLWRYWMGDLYTRSHPLATDLDNDGIKDLVAWTSSPDERWLKRGLPEAGSVVRLSNGGQETHRFDAGVTICDCCTGDLDGDGKQEVLVTDREGFLHVLDSNLKELRRTCVTDKMFTRVDLSFAGIDDVTGDGRPDIILLSSQVEFVAGLNEGDPTAEQNVRITHDLKLLLLDAQLQTRGSVLLVKRWPGYVAPRRELHDVDGDGQPEVLVFGPKLVIVKWARRFDLLSARD